MNISNWFLANYSCVATTIYSKSFLRKRSLPGGIAFTCWVYETSSDPLFASFSEKSAIFISRFTQIPIEWNLGKPGWGGEV